MRATISMQQADKLPMSDCTGMPDSMDSEAPQLCHAHCSGDRESALSWQGLDIQFLAAHVMWLANSLPGLVLDRVALRACSKSFEQEHQECQVDELQAGVEPSLAVLPQPPVLVQPGKAAFHDPALGHHFESVKLASLGDLHRHMPSQNLLHALRERPTDVACIAQQAL